MNKLLFFICILTSFLTAYGSWGDDRWGDDRWGDDRWGDDRWGRDFVEEAVWLYRAPLIVVNDGAERTAYATRFKLGSGNFTFANALTDGADFRVVTENGDTLNHWIRSDLSWGDDTCEVYVEVDTIEAGTDTIGYLLYGNASASSTSNGDSTFIVFQDWDSNYVVCGQSTPPLFDTFVDYSTSPVLTRAGEEIREFGNAFWIGDTIYLPCPAYSGSYQGDRDTMITHLAKSVNGTTWVWTDSILGTETDSNWVEDWFVVTNGCELGVNKNTPYTRGDTMFALGEDKGHEPYDMCLYTSIDSFKTLVYYGSVMTPEGDEDLIASPVCWWEPDSNRFLLFYEASVSGVMAGGCYAWSDDLYSWTRSPDNPVLELGANGTWDDVSIVVHDGFWIGDTFHIWYHASDGATARFGFATATDFGTWTKDDGNPYRLGSGTNPIYVDGKYLTYFAKSGYNDVFMGYFWRFDTTGWRGAYPDWQIQLNGETNSIAYIEDGVCIIAGEQGEHSGVSLVSDLGTFTNGFSVDIWAKVTNYENEGYIYSSIFFGKDSIIFVGGNPNETAADSGYAVWLRKETDVRIREYNAGSASDVELGLDVDDAVIKAWGLWSFMFSVCDSLRLVVNDGVIHIEHDATFSANEKHVGFTQGEYDTGADWGGVCYNDWFAARKFSYPPPMASVGAEEDN